MECQFSKYVELEKDVGKFTTFGHIVFSSETIPQILKTMQDQFGENIETFSSKRSG
jgi:hypothetical protein